MFLLKTLNLGYFSKWKYGNLFTKNVAHKYKNITKFCGFNHCGKKWKPVVCLTVFYQQINCDWLDIIETKLACIIKLTWLLYTEHGTDKTTCWTVVAVQEVRFFITW